MNFEKLELLATWLLRVKFREEKAREERIAFEEEIAELIPTGDTSSKTVTLPNGRRITVKRGLIYKADLAEVSRLCAESDMAPPIKTKTARELDTEGYESYRRMEPGFFSRLTKHVTVTPRKVAVVLREPKDD